MTVQLTTLHDTTIESRVWFASSTQPDAGTPKSEKVRHWNHPTHTACALACLLGMAATTLATAQHQHPAPRPERLGSVHFKVECNALAQKEIDLAMAYYHSFAFPQTQAPLERALKADPGCGMAHFVLALALLDIPFTWPGSVSTKKLADGSAALDAARATGLKSERERDYVAALTAFYRDHDKLNHKTRAKALEDELEKVAQRYPEDHEALILHSLVLSANFDPTDKSYANQLRAARQLEPLYKAYPNHPGVAHYLIHSYDYPPIAKHGLDAARRYSKIAPDASHAQHMPSHIFTRIGAWGDSIASNKASAKSDGGKTWNSLHAFDYMVYAHLQQSQDRAARRVMEEAQAQGQSQRDDHLAAAYAFSAIPARIALETGAWSEAAALMLTPAAGAYPWEKYPQAEAVHAFARGIGAAMLKDSARAQVELARLHQLRDAATALKIAYWADQIDIQADIVRGLTARAEGRVDEGVDILRKAAAREDATEKHVVTPGPIVPAREVLAHVLLDQDKPADALKEFESVLQREPNRLRATLGAARSAEDLGDKASARAYYRKVRALTKTADSIRPELLHARRALGRG
jgi:Tfp pilus assembly protein PilF